jgi:hypothetical protein
MSAPHPVLARFDDAELIAELERRTKSALRKASGLDTGPLMALQMSASNPAIDPMSPLAAMWCDQCERCVKPAEAERCASDFCKARADA